MYASSGDKGALAFAEGLGENGWLLEELFLGKNGLSDVAADALGSSLQMRSSLAPTLSPCTLGLDYNYFTTIGLGVLAKVPRSICSVNMDGNSGETRELRY